MAENRARKLKRMGQIKAAAPTESSKTADQIYAEMGDEISRSAMQCATRVLYFMQDLFPDVTGHMYTNAECRAYVEHLRALVDGHGDDVRPVSEGSQAEVVDDAEDEDCLAEAIRAAMPDAPKPGADIDECEAFAGRLADVRMESVTGYANAGKFLKSACPDLPDVSDGDSCRAYIDDLAAAAARSRELEAKVEMMERLFGPILALAPEPGSGMEQRFEDGWSSYLASVMPQVKAVIRGAMRDD